MSNAKGKNILKDCCDVYIKGIVDGGTLFSDGSSMYDIRLENGDHLEDVPSRYVITSVPSTPEIEKVLYDTKQDRPVTVVFWKDGTKTWVKCAEGDVFSKWSGLALCYCKKMLCDNDTVKFHQMFKRWCE